jgi:hypothetical protein
VQSKPDTAPSPNNPNSSSLKQYAHRPRTTHMPPICHPYATQELMDPNSPPSSNPMQHTNTHIPSISHAAAIPKELCMHIPTLYLSHCTNSSFPHLPTEKMFTHMYLPFISQTTSSPNNLNSLNLKQYTTLPRTAHFSRSRNPEKHVYAYTRLLLSRQHQAVSPSLYESKTICICHKSYIHQQPPENVRVCVSLPSTA